MTPGPRPSRPRWRRIVQALVSVAVVVGIFVGVFPRIADYGEVWQTISDMTWLEVTTLAAAGLWNLVTYWFVLTAGLPGLRLREAAVVNQASTAISNTLPAGGALGVGVTITMLTSWGFPPSAIGLQTIVTGLWNNFVKLGTPVLALVLLALEGQATAGRIVAALVGIGVLTAAIVLFALVLRNEALARAAGRRLERLVGFVRRLFRRDPITGFGDRVVSFRTRTIDLLSRRWVRLTASTLVSHGSLFLVLLLALRHVGVGNGLLSWIAVLAAFAFVRLISALPITPGGVGIVELGYAAVLTIGLDDATSAKVVGAILVFRAITYLLPVPLGAISYVVWRRNRSWRMSPAERQRLANP
jgi:uncharacterized protein (TIRG00374 family)